MRFYLSYIVFKDEQRKLGHTSLAISQQENDLASPEIICRVGLWRTSQIQVEDFLQAKERREFFHKTYAITEAEVRKFFDIINRDRAIEQTSLLSPVFVENKKSTSKPPGGKTHTWLTHNCKTYALDIMSEIGINDPSLQNQGPDIPIWSGELHPLKFIQHPKKENILIWDSPLLLIDRNSLPLKEKVSEKKLFNDFKEMLERKIKEYSQGIEQEKSADKAPKTEIEAFGFLEIGENESAVIENKKYSLPQAKSIALALLKALFDDQPNENPIEVIERWKKIQVNAVIDRQIMSIDNYSKMTVYDLVAKSKTSSLAFWNSQDIRFINEFIEAYKISREENYKYEK